MKQTKNIINIEKLMSLHELTGLGAEQGKDMFKLLSSHISTHPEFNLFYFELHDVVFDASFAREGIVKLAKHYRMEKGVCLKEVHNKDLLDNILGPVLRLKQPIACYIDNALTHVAEGKIGSPSATNKKIFNFILSNGASTANDVAYEFDMKLNNSSTKLKQLFEEGFLLRKEEKSETGGIEFLYYTVS